EDEALAVDRLALLGELDRGARAGRLRLFLAALLVARPAEQWGREQQGQEGAAKDSSPHRRTSLCCRVSTNQHGRFYGAGGRMGTSPAGGPPRASLPSRHRPPTPPPSAGCRPKKRRAATASRRLTAVPRPAPGRRTGPPCASFSPPPGCRSSPA